MRNFHYDCEAAPLSLGGIAKRTGVRERTLRRAAAEHVLPAPVNATSGSGNHRYYHEKDLPRIQLIGRLMDLGLASTRAREYAEQAVLKPATDRHAEHWFIAQPHITILVSK